MYLTYTWFAVKRKGFEELWREREGKKHAMERRDVETDCGKLFGERTTSCMGRRDGAYKRWRIFAKVWEN